MTPHTLDLIFFILLTILQALDAYSTLMVLKRNKGTEANPIMAWLFEKMGVEAALIFTKVSVIIVAYYYLDWQPMAGLCALYAYVVWSNFKILNNNR